MGKVPELVSLSISAWSLKARFALKHHAIKYRTTPYIPVIGEAFLRFRLGEWQRKVSVPVMFTPSDGVLTQSYDIALWADAHSARPGAEVLFPQGAEPEVSKWNAKSDTVLYFGRRALVESVMSDPDAQRRLVPPGLRWLGPLGPVLVRFLVGRLGSKYKTEGSSTSLEKALEVLREAQAVLRSAPAGPDGLPHLVGGALSYADMAMAVAALTVKPLGPPFTSNPRPPLKEVMPYVEEFAELSSWSDSIFKRYFPTDEKQGKGTESKKGN